MRFLELRVEAFNRFKESFSLKLDSQGLVLVEGENHDHGGSNGSGKSLIWEALLWCLYGKMPRYGDRLVTQQACHSVNGASVSVVVLIGEVVFSIHRSRTTKGSPEFKVQVAPLVAGGMIGDFEPYTRLSRDPGKRAEDVTDLLGLAYTAARSSLVLGRASDLPGQPFAAQMAVLESILRLKELSVASDLARRRAGTVERELSSAKAVLESHDRLLGRAELDLNEAHTRAAGGQLQADCTRLEAELVDAEQCAAQCANLQQVLADMETAAGRLQKAYNETVLRATRAVDKQEELESQLAKSICPTCKRPLEQVDVAKVQARLDEVKKAVIGAYSAKADADRKFQGAALKARGTQDEFRRAQRAKDQVPKIREALQQVQALRGELARQVQTAERRLAEAQAAKTQAQEKVDALRAQLASVEFWVDAYGRDGLQAEIFSAAVPVVNHAAARASQALTRGAIGMTVNPLRDSAGMDLIRLTGTEAPTYDGLSSGQQQRVLLILALALRALARWRLPEPVNLSVFDEVFDHIDPEGLDVVARLLADETRGPGASCFVVTHNPTMKARFPGARIVRVVREDNLAVVYAA